MQNIIWIIETKFYLCGVMIFNLKKFNMPKLKELPIGAKFIHPGTDGFIFQVSGHEPFKFASYDMEGKIRFEFHATEYELELYVETK